MPSMTIPPELVCEWCGSLTRGVSQVPVGRLTGSRYCLCQMCVSYGASRNFWDCTGVRHGGHAPIPMDGLLPAVHLPSPSQIGGELPLDPYSTPKGRPRGTQMTKTAWDRIVDDDFDERCEAYVPPPSVSTAVPAMGFAHDISRNLRLLVSPEPQYLAVYSMDIGSAGTPALLHTGLRTYPGGL